MAIKLDSLTVTNIILNTINVTSVKLNGVETFVVLPSTTTATPTIEDLFCLTNLDEHYTEILADIKNNSSKQVTLYLSPSGDYLGTLDGNATKRFTISSQPEGKPGSTTVSVYAKEVGKNPSAVATKTQVLTLCQYTD